MKPTAVTGDFRVTRSDVRAFAAAGGDASPLHVDDGHARRTPFGQPVAHGALCVLRALALVPVAADVCLVSLRARFLGPVFPDQRYTWETPATGETGGPDTPVTTLRVADGGTVLLEIEARYAPGAVSGPPPAPTRRRFVRRAAGSVLQDLVPGTEFGTRYRPDWPALARLVDEAGLARHGVGVEHAAVLAWASQLAGMEVPGRSALVGGIDADFEQAPARGVFAARAVLADVDTRFRSVRLTGEVTAGHTTATVEVRSFSRREFGAPDTGLLRDLLGPDTLRTRPLAGRTAVVCGGSRGLGAALVQAFALAGATVHLIHRDSAAEAAALVDALDHDGARVHVHQADVGDTPGCREVREEVLRSTGAPDILVLNAAPPVRPLDPHPDTVTRSGEHLAAAVRLVQAPLAAFLADLPAGGLVVAVSSAYAERPRRGLSHYTAAKRAVEGLVEAVTVDRPDLAALVVRPPRLATAFGDSVTDDDVLAVERAAATVAVRVAEGVPVGTVGLLTRFESARPETSAAYDTEAPAPDGPANEPAPADREPDGPALAVAATFTTDPLHAPLAHWCGRLGLGLTVRPAPYGQVFQQLLDPAGIFASNTRGCNAVLLRVEDWPEGPDGERTADEFAEAVRAAAARFAVPLLVLLCPGSPPAVQRRGQALRAMEERLTHALDGVPGVRAVRVGDRADGHWVADHHDPAREELAHIPYTPEACTVLATAVARQVHALLGRPYKVLVLDCDNTLWRGVCGEDGPGGVEIADAHLALQRWAVERHDEGVLVCLASKNTAEDVDDVFRHHPGMPLRPEHIAARRVDWNPKADNLRALADELLVGIDSFVFLDDNPVEVAAVRAAQPDVLALTLPADESRWPAFLARLWSFDRAEVTDEDRRRTAMYRASRRREEARGSATSLAAFIDGLALEVDVHEATGEQLARVAQLTQRTNQFNLAPHPRTLAELRALLAGGAHCRVAEVRDRFGDYGLVGVAVTRESAGAVVLDTFLLSCRVLGRGVEHAFLASVARALMAGTGPAELTAGHRPTGRNTPAADFFRDAMGQGDDARDGTRRHRAPLDRLAALRFRPDARGALPDGPAGGVTPAATAPAYEASRRTALAELACELTDGAALHRAVTDGSTDPDSSPPSEREQSSAEALPHPFEAVREVVSRLARVPVTDLTPETTLESLRLQSLEIVDATVALEKVFGRQPKTLFFEHATLGALSRALVPAPNAGPAAPKEPRAARPAEARSAPPTPGRANSVHRHDNNDIAVVGIAGRYPGAEDITRLWDNLKAGAESLGDVAGRWGGPDAVDPRGGPDRTYSSSGGLLDGIDEFDALFFHLAPSEARTMDPQQRLFLQAAHHALEDAGHTAASIGRDVGVYVASMGPDYAVLSANAALEGNSRYPNSDLYQLANRVSHFMDFTGPSIAVDTACSGSGVAIQLACDAIRSGTVSAALAGGVNLILHPARRIQYAQLGMISPTGRCRPFGDGADGMVTSEGVGVVLLRPLRDALADGDHVYGVVKAASANSDGRTNGFTVPNPRAQADLIARTLRRAGADPSTIGYVEAHGTGTPLGDPIEIRGLGSAFAAVPSSSEIPVGSIKGNIGHTEAAAAVAGLTKVLLQLRHRTLVPSLHSERLNPDIDFAATPFRVQQHNAPWPAPPDGARRRAGLSSFGAGGVNVHLVIEEAPDPAPETPRTTGPELVLLSARDDQTLRRTCARLAGRLRSAGSEPPLADTAFTLREGREHLAVRVALVVSGTAELVDRLESLAAPDRTVEEAARHTPGAVWGRADDGRLGDVFDGGDPADDMLRTLVADGDRSGLEKLGRLWSQGARVNPGRILPSTGRRRVSLPGYPFARQRHWLPVTDTAPVAAPSRDEPSVTLYTPVWKPAPAPTAVPADGAVVLVVGGPPEWADGAPHQVAHPRELAAAVGGGPYDIVVVDRRGLEHDGGALTASLDRASETLDALAALADGRSCTYITVTRPDRADPAAALFTGFGRALEHEAPGFRPIRVEVDPGAPEPALAEILDQVAAGDREVRVADGARLVPTWSAAGPGSGGTSLRRGAHYVITGGAGGLGRLLTAHLVEHWAAKVTWLGRSGGQEDGTGEARHTGATSGGAVHTLRADVTDADALAAALAAARRRFGPVHGVVHAAGLLHDAPAREQTGEQLRSVLAPKTFGSVAVDSATADDPLDFFVMMSSFVGTLGNGGQTAYCAANRFLDAFAEHRRSLVERGERSGRSVSVAWPLWREGSMRMPDSVRRLIGSTLGFGQLDTPAGLLALENALRQDSSRVLVAVGDQDRIAVALARPAVPPPTGAATRVGDHESRLRELLRREAADLVKVDVRQLTDTTAFGDYGFNSLLFTDFANRLNDLLGVAVTPVVFYQHPTVDALTTALLETVTRVPELSGTRPSDGAGADAGPRTSGQPVVVPPGAEQTRPATLPAAPLAVPPSGTPSGTPSVMEPVAVIGMAGRLPGSPDLDTYWRHLLERRDLVGPAPADRFGLSDVRGGFLEDVLAFDAEFFALSPREAALMDPQQRLFLETAWQAVEDAAIRPSSLAGSRTGVFVGATLSDYADLLGRADEKIAAQSITGHVQSVIANRVSYLLDLRGPSEVVDTACSSSLTALHRALGALAAGECDLAIAGGVNTLFDPDWFDSLGQAGLLSETGRCWTFDGRADGFVRGEGVGAVVLKPLSRAIADGDPVRAVLRGSAVAHGGRAHSLTAPRPEAQAEVVTTALARAGVDPRTISYVETHGTGTRLGDPIEIAGLTAAFGRPAEGEAPWCQLGAVKPNIGHLESAAGIAGLLKVLLAIEHRTLPPNAVGDTPNPHLRLDGTAFALPDRTREWRPVDTDGAPLPLRAGLSAFGFGGANAHLVVEEPPAAVAPGPSRTTPGEPHVLLLSAPDQDRLRAHARALRDELLCAQRDFADLAYTSRVARDPMPARLALVVPGPGEAVAALDAFLAGGAVPLPHTATGSGSGAIGTDPARAARWAAGEDMEWPREPGRRRVPLCVRPFDHSTRYGPSGLPTGTAPSWPERSEHVVVRDDPALRLLAQVRRAEPPVPGPVAHSRGTLLVLAPEEADATLLEEVAGADRDVVVLRGPSRLPLPCARTVETDLGDRERTLAALAEARSAHGPFTMVVDLVDALAGPGRPPRTAGRVALLQELAAKAADHPLTLVHVRRTPGSRTSSPDGELVLTAGRMAGFVRAAGAEYGSVTAVTVAYDTLPPGTAGTLGLAVSEGSGATPGTEVRWTAGTREILVAEEVAPPRAPGEGRLGAFPVAADRPYVITGGTGGLGLAAAELLVARGARRIALTGRRELPPRERWQDTDPDVWWGARTAAITRMEHAGAQVLLHHGGPDRLQGFLDDVRTRFGRPAGILHCAGALSSTPAFVHKKAEEFDLTWEPKGPVLAALVRALGDDEPDFVVLYSSVSARLPALAVGLADYAAANAALDDYADFASAAARARGSATRWLSIGWGSWSGVGMGAVTTPRYDELGLVPMGAEDGLALLDAALAVPEHGILTAVAVRPDERPAPVSAPTAGRPSPQDSPPQTAETAGDGAHAALVERLSGHVTGILAETLGMAPERIGADRPFADLGVDSILIASIVVRLEAVTGTAVEPSAVLEHPTVRRLARHLASTRPEAVARWAGGPGTANGGHGEAPPVPDPVPAPGAGVPRGARAETPLAVIGMAGRFPGAPDTHAYWDLLAHGRSGIREVPRSRWDVASLYSPEYTPGMSVGKWGGYLDGIEDFDPEYFGIPEADAAHIDPLTRLVLETTESALADAGYRGEELAGRRIGVYVGSGSSGYASRVTVPGRATATGLNQNFIAAHLAHLHDLRGPNLVVDTACSSSLSSLHLARQALRLGECEMALVGGADLLLDETRFLSLSAARALSPDGTCHVFDAAANGFVPGEGVGVVLVKPLAAALADGDRVLAVIESTAMNNDGRTMGLTTPNPEAQQDVVREALRAAEVSASSVSYVEAHGTGTMIGDPMELRALTAVFAESTDERGFCAVGSVKSNVGHLLMAAGMAGLQKIVLSLGHRQLPPTLHCERPNPRFAFETSPFRVQDRLEPWQRREGVRRAGLSAFGFGGTNCHVVLREPTDTELSTTRSVRSPLAPPVFRRRRHWVERTSRLDPSYPRPRPMFELEELI